MSTTNHGMSNNQKNNINVAENGDKQFSNLNLCGSNNSYSAKDVHTSRPNLLKKREEPSFSGYTPHIQDSSIGRQGYKSPLFNNHNKEEERHNVWDKSNYKHADNSSTLAAHIASYQESFPEARETVNHNSSINSVADAVVQHSTSVEVMKFKRSQQLLNVNNTTPPLNIPGLNTTSLENYLATLQGSQIYDRERKAMEDLIFDRIHFFPFPYRETPSFHQIYDSDNNPLLFAPPKPQELKLTFEKWKILKVEESKKSDQASTDNHDSSPPAVAVLPEVLSESRTSQSSDKNEKPVKNSLCSHKVDPLLKRFPFPYK